MLPLHESYHSAISSTGEHSHTHTCQGVVTTWFCSSVCWFTLFIVALVWSFFLFAFSLFAATKLELTFAFHARFEERRRSNSSWILLQTNDYCDYDFASFCSLLWLTFLFKLQHWFKLTSMHYFFFSFIIIFFCNDVYLINFALEKLIFLLLYFILSNKY